MLETIFGSENAEKVLLFILKREKGYPSEIASFYSVSLSMVQKQLEKFEQGGILVCQNIGKTKVYSFNPRYAFLPELKALLEKAFGFYPEEVKEDLEFNRRRPRRSDT
jgi:predicted transcriptional regulator